MSARGVGQSKTVIRCSLSWQTLLCFSFRVMTAVSTCIWGLALLFALHPGSSLQCPSECACSECDPQAGFPGNASLACRFDNISYVSLIVNPGEVCSLWVCVLALDVVTQECYHVIQRFCHHAHPSFMSQNRKHALTLPLPMYKLWSENW